MPWITSSSEQTNISSMGLKTVEGKHTVVAMPSVTSPKKAYELLSQGVTQLSSALGKLAISGGNTFVGLGAWKHNINRLDASNCY